MSLAPTGPQSCSGARRGSAIEVLAHASGHPGGDTEVAAVRGPHSGAEWWRNQSNVTSFKPVSCLPDATTPGTVQLEIVGSGCELSVVLEVEDWLHAPVFVLIYGGPWRFGYEDEVLRQR